MKKAAGWILIGVLMLGIVYALAEGSVATTKAPKAVQAIGMGDEGEGVFLIQRKLAELNYYSGEISGKFDNATQAALRTFQKDYSLTSTGDANAETQAALNTAKYRPLQKGDSGEDVKELQARLTELDYYYGKISGNFLEGSYYAICDFQNKHGLPVTGEADINTLELLYNASALSKKATRPPETQSPLITPSPTPAPTPTPAPIAPSGDMPTADASITPSPEPTGIAFTKRLQKGSKGEKVEQLQQRLFVLGYYMDEVTGTYDAETKAAIIEFQKNNNLTTDGVTGEKTWNMLFNISDVLDSSATPRPTPAPTPVPYAITIDVTNQVVTAYGLDENNEYTKVVRQMICSTGTKATPSDLGVFKLGAGRSRFPLFPKYNCYVQYWVPIVNGIGFHSVIYNTKNTMDLAEYSYHQLGTRASHGCIRLLVDDAKWIYENAGKGTVVTITNQLPADPELTQSLKPAALNRKNMLPKTTPAPTEPPVYDASQEPPLPMRSLSRGSKGEDVYWLQMKLKEMGYYNGTVTGGYYGGTQKAVKAYQKDNGLTADGVAGVKTQSHLYADVLPTATPKVEASSD